MREDPTAPNVPGVRTLEHTADVGLELEAPTLAELLRRAALGLSWLLLERVPAGAREERALRADAAGPETLLRETLRALLWWHDSEGLAPVDLKEVRVDETGGGFSVTARALLSRGDGAPVREIKGVTLHGLAAEPSGDRWRGRVIFDV